MFPFHYLLPHLQENENLRRRPEPSSISYDHGYSYSSPTNYTDGGQEIHTGLQRENAVLRQQVEELRQYERRAVQLSAALNQEQLQRRREQDHREHSARQSRAVL